MPNRSARDEEYEVYDSRRMVCDAVAFANTLGGNIHILKPEDPIKAAEKALSDLSRFIVPGNISKEACIIECSKKRVKILIPAIPRVISCLRDEGSPDGVYIRKNGHSIRPNKTELASLLDRIYYLWDDEPALRHHSTIFDMSFVGMNEYCNKHNIVPTAIIDSLFRLKSGYYNKLAYLFSDQCEEKVLVYVQHHDSVGQQAFTGPLFQQLEEATHYITERMGVVFSCERIPSGLVRTALLSAIIYRDYTLQGNITVRITEEGLLITYPGRPAAPYTANDLVTGGAYPVNPEVVKVLSMVGAGSACDADFFLINQKYSKTNSTPRVQLSDNVTSIELPYLYDSMETEMLNVKEEQVLMLLKTNGSLARAEIQNSLGFPQATTVRILNSLVEKDIIIKVGSGRSTCYRVH